MRGTQRNQKRWLRVKPGEPIRDDIPKGAVLSDDGVFRWDEPHEPEREQPKEPEGASGE